MTLTHAVIRQAEQGVRGSADGVRIINTDILACDQAVALTRGSSRAVNLNVLQPDDFILRESRLMYSTDGLIITGVNNEKYFYISSSSLSHNSNGINIKNWASSSGEIETHLYVTDCHIEANSGYGIWDQTRSYVTVERSSLIGPSQRGYMSYRHYGRDNIPVTLTFRDSYFAGFSSSAVYTWCYSCNSVNWSFYNNRFENQPREGLFIHHIRQNRERLNLDVVNNTFHGLTGNYFAVTVTTSAINRWVMENNTFDATQGGISVSGDSNNNIEVSLTGNTFTNLGPNKYPIAMERATAYITGNLFQQCTAHSLIYLETSIDHVISENQFINNTIPNCFIEVHPDNPYDRYNSIQANRNYWDTQDVHRIKDVICDFFLDSNRARVEMTEFYTSADMSTTVSNPNADDFRYDVMSDLNTVVIGGVITSSGDTSLVTSLGYTLVVNRSIIIESGVTVDLHSVTVEFAENRGVVVFGE